MKRRHSYTGPMPEIEREPPYEEPGTITHAPDTDEGFVAINHDNSAAEVGALIPARAGFRQETEQQTSFWVQTDSDIDIEPNLSWNGSHSVQEDPLQYGFAVSRRSREIAWTGDDSLWALPPNTLPFDFLASDDLFTTD